MGDALHFLSEARLAQTASFVDTCNAALARLSAVNGRQPLPPQILGRFAELAETARTLQREMRDGIGMMLVENGAPPDLIDDPAAQRLKAGAERVLERLAEMIGRLENLPGEAVGRDLPNLA